jgi:hypothetical protein
MADGDACEIVEILARRYVGEIFDRVIAKLIDEGESQRFSQIIDGKV